ncbi:asparagine synthase-related protein [Sphingomonas koreensis]
MTAIRFLAALNRQSGSEAPLAGNELERAGLIRAASTDAFQLWTNVPSAVLSTPSGRTRVLGRMFTHSDCPTIVSQLDPFLDRESDVASLFCTRFWGQYVMFSLSSLGALQVLRDPSGALPCYFHEADGRLFFFSDLDVLRAAGIGPPAIDWAGVRDCLAWPTLRPKGTALLGVHEIQQGWLLAVGGSHFSQLRRVWSPWDHVHPTPLIDHALAEALEAKISGAVGGLASAFDKVQLCLSGGLDSSVVAACLPATKTLCLNMVADGPEGDERREARLVAEHLQLALIERAYRFDHVDLMTSSAAHLPRPVGNSGRLGFDRANLEIARERGAQALFTGFGGDNVFCFMRSATPIADRIRAKSSPVDVYRTTLDVCRLTGCTVATALGQAWRKIPAGAARYRWSLQGDVLTAEALAGIADQPEHSWLDAPAGALPGRAAHIVKLMRTQNFAEGLARNEPIELVNPLLAQPIMELCLSIPSWKWIEGGRDRAMARSAFLKRLPAATLARQTKGGPSAYHRQIIDDNRAALHSMLVDGELVRNGLIDPAAVERSLRTPLDTPGFIFNRLLDLADAEAWVRRHSR